jgi:hypothetical protein
VHALTSTLGTIHGCGILTLTTSTYQFKINGKNVNDMGEKDIEENIWTNKENGQWRIKTNAELITKYKAPDTVNVIKIQRMEWLRHVVRMSETRSVKKIFEGKLEGQRGRGGPRLRWINDVQDDLRKLGVKQWRTKALEREEWASILKEGKAKIKGL